MKKQTIIVLILSIVLCQMLPATEDIPAWLRAEIEENLVRPCTLKIMRGAGLMTGFSDDDVIRLVKSGEAGEHYDTLIEDHYRTLKKADSLDPEDKNHRLVLFELALKKCG